jgi:ferredoxin-NADP reductase
MPTLPWRKGIVIKIEQATSTTRRYWIQVPEVEHFDFKPGQFVTLDLPIHEKPARRWRSYSIASWPGGTNVFELVIVLMEGGTGTQYIFHELQVGSELSFRGPLGVFTLPEPIDRDLFLICTGTGVAPFRSMVHHIINHQLPHENIYLVFGCRHFGDNLYGEELKELMKRDSKFQYIPTYSREQPGSDGSYCTGYVHTIYEKIARNNTKKHEDETAGATLRPAYFYLCGWKDMIEEAKRRIQALGYERKAIHQELYG